MYKYKESTSTTSLFFIYIFVQLHLLSNILVPADIPAYSTDHRSETDFYSFIFCHPSQLRTKVKIYHTLCYKKPIFPAILLFIIFKKNSCTTIFSTGFKRPCLHIKSSYIIRVCLIIFLSTEYCHYKEHNVHT